VATHPLVERHDELARLDAVLGAARSGAGATLVIEGPAGIGKTSLSASVRERAARSGMTVLHARGTPLEREYALGVVRQWLEPVVAGDPNRDGLFAGAAQLAERVVLAVPEGLDAAPVGVLHGLYWLTANLAERGPLLVAIHDAHWAGGLWHWKAPHPQWEPTEPWGQDVSSYAIDDGQRLLLFDPLGVPSDIEELAADRETAIVLTAPWHERDAQSLAERLGVPVFTPSPDTAENLLRMYDFTAPEGWISRTCDGLSTARPARRTGTRPAIDCPSESRRSPDRSATTWSSGSRATVRWLQATRSPTLARPSDQPSLACRRCDARAGRRRPAPAARPAGRALPRDTRGPYDRSALERALS
jgi:AAA ATPase domain